LFINGFGQNRKGGPAMSRFQKMFVTMVAGMAAALSGTRQRLQTLTAAGPAVGTSVTLLTLMGLLRVRVAELHKDERGDGGGSALTTVLLAVGGVIAVGAVVTGVGVAIAAALGKLG
jgi:hypothetical protein